MDTLSDTTAPAVHPLVKALQDKIDALNGGPATLASKVDAFAKQANIGSYSWSLGVAQVNKVFAAIGSLICDNTPAQAARLPVEWKAPTVGSAFYTLTLSPGFDIPVFLAPLDQEDQEGRIGHCLGLQFPSENGPMISNSALGLVITVGIKDEPQPLGSFVVGCRHYVCYSPKKRLQTNPLSAVSVCDTDCASCDVANCPTEPNKSAYKSLTASISRGNGDKINQLPDPANKCKEPHNIMKPGADLIWNKEDPDKPSKRPDVLLIPIQNAGDVVPMELDKAKAGWEKLFTYVPGSVRSVSKPLFDKIDKTADKFGSRIEDAELQALLAKGTVYV
ncbi:hypothetical protein MSAN_01729100 [Mycena sanguinolenta]|uniref:Uncharacterized protein n=1 Tax=Mycena sanguinolenta TaxID=230812 RepID=A0A8H7CW00_9AGAR|nr:hypothetical protein MSAN_01729100 [Mycena sanguinolenta]